MFGRSTFYTKESSSSQLEDFDPTKYDFPKYTSHGTSAFEHSTCSPTTEFETEKHPVVSYESQSIDKSVIQEEPVIKFWDKESRRSKVSRRMRIILFPVVLVALFLIYGFKKINQDREGSMEFNSERVGINRNDREDLELPLFDFKTIANATDQKHKNRQPNWAANWLQVTTRFQLFTISWYEAKVLRRAAFLKHNLWVTPYARDEMFTGGEFLNQNPRVGEGLATWV